MPKPIVAIIGRPNVGKSTLFNRILGGRRAIVLDEPGVTRDRHYADTDWSGKEFVLIDTGGYVPDSADVFERAIREQVEIAIAEANVILFLVDGQEGVLPLDEEIARLLRKSAKSVLLVVNKIDSDKHSARAAEFFSLGLGEPISISAISGRMTGDFLDRLIEGFSDRMDTPEGSSIHLAIIGRPNVGKSSLTNALLGKERAIVTDVPGTTRDSFDSLLSYQGQEITLIDTAGLRRRSKVRENVEFYSALRTVKSIQRCDVALCLIDATAGLTHQDIEVIDEAVQHHKGIVIAVNKWDLVEKDARTAQTMEAEILGRIKTVDYAPVMFVSAITRQRIFKLIDICLAVHDERRKRIPTSELNNVLLPIFEATPPPSTSTGKEVKINFVTQVREAPPVIVFFTNFPKHIPESYRRFMERSIRKEFGFHGVPLTVQFRSKRNE